jgi:hypothetical protein
MCAIEGPAGKKELAGLVRFAVDGWNIAFMDPHKEVAKKVKQELKNKYNIKINVVNEKENPDSEGYDIEGFFYHGSWDVDEDVDIFWSFLEGKYGGANYIISKT